MTRADKIRAALRAAPHPLTSGEICEAVPGIRTHHAVGALYRDGHLGREGTRGSYRYWILREPISRKIYTAEELKVRRNEREKLRAARRRREAGAPTIEESRRIRKADAERRAALKEAQREKVKAEREAARQAKLRDPAYLAQREAAKTAARKKSEAKRRAAIAKKRPKVSRTYNIAIEPARPQLSDPPKRVVVAETVEEYLARGGRVEVLPGVGERAAA